MAEMFWLGNTGLHMSPRARRMARRGGLWAPCPFSTT